MDRFAIVVSVCLLVFVPACSEPVSLTGTWSGSNSNYTSVVLDLTELGDSITGSVRVAPTGGSEFTTSVAGARTGNGLQVRGDPLPPSAGPGAFGTTFSGALTFGGRLAGCLSAREQPCSRISLGR
jgi:hypothetical protein